MPELQQTGNFRARVLKVGCKEEESGAVMAYFSYEIIAECLPSGEWTPDWNPGYTVEGSECFVSGKDKGNEIMEDTMRRVGKALGWTGNTDELQNTDWSNIPVHISVKSEVYKEKTRFKASWLSPNGSPFGGAIRASDDAGLASLKKKYGRDFTSLLKDVKPPTAGAAKPMALAGRPAEAQPPAGDDIPF